MSSSGGRSAGDEDAARSDILAALRAEPLPKSELPKIAGRFTTYPDLAAQFTSAATAAAARVLDVPRAALLKSIQGLDVYANARRVYSTLDGLGRGEIPREPGGAADVDLSIARAEFAVAENGAVWIEGSSVAQRSALYLCQHLLIVVAQAELVATMHDALARLSFSGAGFGCFMAGPSKTADIEQALVIGAHGARSLTVVLTS